MSTTMAKTTPAASSATPAEKMAAPSITLLPEKKSPTNGHSSPARTGKTTPSNTEKKPQINGHASPLHGQTNTSNKAMLEGYMKTDDRVRLAKERREERERSLAAREQMIKEKERRARLQYERTMEERCRRLEEQRLREEQRRAAVEEKRRLQLEEERERLEALMKRSLERSLQLEQRGRRWGRGYPGPGDCENACLPSAASAFPHGIASPIPAVSESAPCSPHRSPYRADHSRVVLQGGSQSTPNTPKKQRLQKYRNISPGYGSPLRRSESPAAVKQTTSPSPKIVTKMRTHSPNSLHPNQNSPSRNPSNLLKDAHKAEDKHTKVSKTDSPQRSVQSDRKSADPKTKGGPPQTIKVNMIEKYHSPERRNQGVKPDVCAQEGDKKKDTASSTSSGKTAAGTTNEEEATRLLAERRRLARALKEQEERKKAQEEEAKLKEEQLKKPVAQSQEVKVETRKEEIKKVENATPKNEHEKQANGVTVQINQNGKEEKDKGQAPEETGRQQQERDLQKQQEEEERQLRKKRIEEIMKRTRKGEGDLKVEDSALADTGEASVSLDGKVKEETDKKEVEAQSKTVNTVVKKEGLTAPQKEMIPNVKNSSASVTKVATPKPEETQQSKDSKNSDPKKDTDQSKECNANLKLANQVKKESTMTIKREGCREVLNGAVKSESLKSSIATITETNRQQTLHVSKTEAKSVSQERVTKPSVTPLPLGQLTSPVIKLTPLEVSGTSSGDEVQSMEVSPVSKEELISIPEFSPVNDALNSSLTNSNALEDLMDLTGSVTYPRLSPQNHIGDCNRNLIQGVVSPVSDSKLVGKAPPSPNKLTVK